MENRQPLLQINSQDNVGVALDDFKEGKSLNLNGDELIVQAEIPQGHKIALISIKKGEKVVKYGFPIGRAIKDIDRGDWVHTHNLKTGLKGKLDYNYQPGDASLNKEENIPTFQGYKRSDGQAGIRNEIWIINTVGCINKPVEKMVYSARERFKEQLEADNMDGIFSFPHPLGCSQLGDDLENTKKVLAGLVKHPNAAAVLVVGLGCENNQIDDFKEFIGDFDSTRISFLNLQDVEDGIEEGLNEIENLIEYAGTFTREKIPVSKLKIGLKCGGSDSFSGITANPLLGRISDYLVSCGGTTILSEVPEMFGAETILMNRAQDEETFDQVVELINGFKDYFLKNGQDIYENPSPGNKEGGITTLEEKSLGNIQKGGTGPVNGVNFYGDQIKENGLQLLESPGNDLVSTTALTVAGAQIILFTTGRGTPFGAPVPTVKISTNSRLYNGKKNWIDFNAGQLLTGKTMGELTTDFLNYLLELASGRKRTTNEINDYKEISIFKTGVTL